jgi:hypothetical protein
MSNCGTASKHLASPPAYQLSPEERLVSVTFSAQLSIRDIEEYVAALCAHPLFDPTFAEIVDLTQVEEIQFSPEDTVVLADVVDPFSTGARRAFVARTGPQIHAARLHQVLRGDQDNIRIFPSIADAKRWINS